MKKKKPGIEPELYLVSVVLKNTIKKKKKDWNSKMSLFFLL